MSSKRWTIVCLTLTLLIFGCSDSEVAKVKVPNPSSADGAAAAFSIQPVPGSKPTLPPRVGANERLEVPPQFQPPELHSPIGTQVPFDGDPQLPPLPGFDGIADVPVHFPGRGNVGGPIDAKEVLGPGLNGERLHFPPEMPGFELPGFENGPGVELRRLRQPGTFSTPNKENDSQSATSS